MWLSDVNAVLFLIFFALGCYLSYSNGYQRGINANLIFRVVNPDDQVIEDDTRD